MNPLRVAAALVLLVQAVFLASLALLAKAMEGWSADPTDKPDPAATWLYLSTLATLLTLAVGLLPVSPVRRSRELVVLATLAAAVAGDAVLIVLLHRWGVRDVLLVVCGLGILAYLALIYARVGGAKGSAARRRTSVG